MLVSVTCYRCRGEGFTLVRRNAHGLFGLFEENCRECNGTGAVDEDANAEVEPWMEDSDG